MHWRVMTTFPTFTQNKVSWYNVTSREKLCVKTDFVYLLRIADYFSKSYLTISSFPILNILYCPHPFCFNERVTILRHPRDGKRIKTYIRKTTRRRVLLKGTKGNWFVLCYTSKNDSLSVALMLQFQLLLWNLLAFEFSFKVGDSY